MGYRIKIKDSLDEGDMVVARGTVYEAQAFAGDCRTTCDCYAGDHCSGLCWRYFNGAGRLNFRRVCEDVELAEGSVVSVTSMAGGLSAKVEVLTEARARSRREIKKTIKRRAKA